MAFENKTFSSEDTLHADDMNNIMEGIVEAKTAAVGTVTAAIAADTNILTVEIKDTEGNMLAQTNVTLPSSGGSGSVNAYTKEETDKKFVAKNTETVSPNLVKRRIYGITYDTEGNPTDITYDVTPTAQANKIPIYNGLGHLSVPENPTNDNYATSKKYVDSLIGNIETALTAILGV